MKEDELRAGLNALLHFVQNSTSDIFLSYSLNNYFDKNVLLQLVEHLLYNIDGREWAFEKDLNPSFTG